MRVGWKFAAASVIGTSHQKLLDGLCQDSHAVSYLEHACALIGVVSDGAGSASHAHIGSRVTCEVIMQEAEGANPDHLFSTGFAHDTIEKIRLCLNQIADEESLEIRDFACTMLVAIVAHDRSTFWQIGDGAICVRDADSDQFRCVYWPEKGEYANVTFFLTDVRAQQEAQISLHEGAIDELAIFSDGLERLALNFVGKKAHNGFFVGLFTHVRTLPDGRSDELARDIQEFLDSERVNQRTDDDKTLVLATRLS